MPPGQYAFHESQTMTHPFGTVKSYSTPTQGNREWVHRWGDTSRIGLEFVLPPLFLAWEVKFSGKYFCKIAFTRLPCPLSSVFHRLPQRFGSHHSHRFHPTNNRTRYPGTTGHNHLLYHIHPIPTNPPSVEIHQLLSDSAKWANPELSPRISTQMI